ncbi:MAG: lytic murein transglycosylase [Methylococcaceae bacterium]|nr:lytic murein transglycosylase [Methylococcaceae bacterium]
MHKESLPVINIVYKQLAAIVFLILIHGCTPKQELQTTTPAIALPQKQSYEYPLHALTGTYAQSLAVRHFIQQMVAKQGFEESYLNDLFSQAHRLQFVMRLENAPLYQGTKSDKPKPGSWSRYRRKFVDTAHINNGVTFWSVNAEAIQQASNTYNVDPEYIVAIIGVETFFGRNMGDTCTFDALTTLAFDTQRRSSFFKQELEHFLLMAREEGYKPLEPVGSWAGAMGFGQFMPSSFRRLAVDFNKDGQRNLWHQEDAIGSIAHYFSRHGWQFKQPIAERTLDDTNADTIMLGAQHGHEYWQTYPNFKVIKKYNNSNKYAMAVHQLAQAIKQQYYQAHLNLGYSK